MRIPLLAPKGLFLFEPQEYHDYVRSLYQEPERKAPPSDWSVRMNAKGNPVITVRRKPKWLTRAEVAAIGEELGWPLQRIWIHIIKKKIEIRKGL